MEADICRLGHIVSVPLRIEIDKCLIDNHSSEHDQELDSLLVGPVPVGVNKFTFEADAPNLTRIPGSEIIGVTVILLTCSYDGREFVRVGYYVNNEYTDQALIDEPPAKPLVEKIQRTLLAEKPRVTRFAIKWDSEASEPNEYPPEQAEADAAEDDEAQYAAGEEEEEDEEEEAGPADAEADGLVKDGVAAEGAASADVKTPAEGEVVKDDKDDVASDAGSEDIEGESSDSEMEEVDEEGGVEAAEDEAQVPEGTEPATNGTADVDLSMTEPQEEQKSAASVEASAKKADQENQPQPPVDVMVH